MPEAKIVIKAKDDTVFSYLLYKFQKVFYEVKYGEKKEPEVAVKEKDGWSLKNFTHKLIFKIKRKISDQAKKIDAVSQALKKDYGKAIKEGRIKLEADFTQKKGGIITLLCQGSEKEIQEWTKMTWKDKLALRGVRKWVDIEVIK